jgi:hypothetical protein
MDRPYHLPKNTHITRFARMELSLQGLYNGFPKKEQPVLVAL